ncbi:MAG: iron-sulfur cluster assembly accessory protein [Chloroflexi bacterium]|nr:iron-sulfur cluster assembly accessory protein [Chloroflexota bacterium]
MITLTKAAAEKVSDILREQGSEGAALRIFVQMGEDGAPPQYGMAVEPAAGESDEVVVCEGVKVVVDETSLPWLIGSEVDYIDTLMRSGFTIRNPNLMGSGDGCACGGNCSCGGAH